MVRFQQKVRKRFKNQVSVNLVFINIPHKYLVLQVLFLLSSCQLSFVTVFSHLDVLKGCILILNIIF